MVLVGLIVTVFLMFEARRYRYFNVWHAFTRDRFLRAHDQGRRHPAGSGLDRVAGKGLLQPPRYHITSPARSVGNCAAQMDEVFDTHTHSPMNTPTL
jgi:uncharacterized membrane protein